MRQFRIDVPDATLTDLRRRLDTARLLPDSPNRPPSSLTAGYLRDLVDSWIAFDWRAREEWLNRHPQFVAEIDGATIHFVHRRAETDAAPALLILHGWPHLFSMQLDYADLLPDFHVVVASLPGFAFSTPYARGVYSEGRVAATMRELMTSVLGYDRFLTYGEDLSANVSDIIAARFPEDVAGIVVTHAHFPSPAEREKLTLPEERAFFDRLAAERGPNGGYAHIQATRPDTLATALNDSPAGLLAWLTEKLIEWSDTPSGDPSAVERRLSRERILTEATIYWITQSIASSFGPYYDEDPTPSPAQSVSVPAAVHMQRHEYDYPESLARAFYRDLRTFERLPEGGHFAVAEAPAEMAARTRSFARRIGVLPPP